MYSTANDTRAISRHQARESERLMMKRLFLVVFPICLTATALTRLVRVFGPRDGTVEGSVVAEARAAAYAALGYAFHA
ncbi:hypothetical protein FMN50_05825 [Rhodobacterales bacterium]|nr:hypothetical protein FMN50_05825 [Rhodobacterales bacterium]